MLIRTLSFAFLLALFLGASTPSYAGGGKKKAGAGAGARMLNRFDRNHDGKIDGEEAEHLRGIYNAAAALDTDHDGKLSDSEISAAKIVAGKRKKKTNQ